MWNQGPYRYPLGNAPLDAVSGVTQCALGNGLSGTVSRLPGTLTFTQGAPLKGGSAYTYASGVRAVFGPGAACEGRVYPKRGFEERGFANGVKIMISASFISIVNREALAIL